MAIPFCSAEGTKGHEESLTPLPQSDIIIMVEHKQPLYWDSIPPGIGSKASSWVLVCRCLRRMDFILSSECFCIWCCYCTYISIWVLFFRLFLYTVYFCRLHPQKNYQLTNLYSTNLQLIFPRYCERKKIKKHATKPRGKIMRSMCVYMSLKNMYNYASSPLEENARKWLGFLLE